MWVGLIQSVEGPDCANRLRGKFSCLTDGAGTSIFSHLWIWMKMGSSWVSSLQLSGWNVYHWPTFMTSFNPNYFPKVTSSNTITVGIRASTHGFEGWPKHSVHDDTSFHPSSSHLCLNTITGMFSKDILPLGGMRQENWKIFKKSKTKFLYFNLWWGEVGKNHIIKLKQKYNWVCPELQGSLGNGQFHSKTERCLQVMK